MVADPDVRTALQVLDAAEAPNAGLLVDVWHFFKWRHDAGPCARVAAVQLNNGPRVYDDPRQLASPFQHLP